MLGSGLSQRLKDPHCLDRLYFDPQFFGLEGDQSSFLDGGQTRRFKRRRSLRRDTASILYKVVSSDSSQLEKQLRSTHSKKKKKKISLSIFKVQKQRNPEVG